MDDMATNKNLNLGRRAMGVPNSVMDAGFKVLVAATAVLLVGFGVYYFAQRYYHPGPSVADTDLRQMEERVIQDPQNPDARVMVAWAYLDKGATAQAVAQFNEALKLRENYQAALIGKGTALFRANDLTGALGPLEQVAEINKSNPYKRTLRELQGVYYYLGAIYSQRGRDEEAIDAYLAALDIDRADADSLYGLGMVYVQQNKLDEAAPLLEMAIRFDPVFADGYKGLATVYEKQGKMGQLLWVRAMLSFTQGKYEEALDSLNKSLRVTTDLPEVYQAQGLVYEKMGRSAEALRAYQTALEKDPGLLVAQGGVTRLNR